MLGNLSIRTKFVLVALGTVVAAFGVVLLMMRVLLQVGENSERGWQRLAVCQLIAAANRTRDRMATTLAESVEATRTLTPSEADAQQQQIHALAHQLVVSQSLVEGEHNLHF